MASVEPAATAGAVVAVDGAALPCSGVTSRSRPTSAAGPAASGTPCCQRRYWRATSSAAADAEIAETSPLDGMRRLLPARSTLMLPPNAAGFAW